MRRVSLLGAVMTAALLLLSGVALAAEMIGTPKNDRLVGTIKRDVILARGGDDTVIGRVTTNFTACQVATRSQGAQAPTTCTAETADGLRGGDELSGGNNNDTINAVGGGHALINCGLGTDDQVIADADAGVNGDCERVTRR